MIPPEQIDSGEYSVISFDNEGAEWRESCGSVSWQIFDEKSNKPVVGKDGLGRRLNIAYVTTYK